MHFYIQNSQSLAQRLDISKQQIFSLKILSMSSYDLFQYVDNLVLSQPDFIFVNRKKLIRQFKFDDYAAQDNTNYTEMFFDRLHEQINQLVCDTSKKEFLHHVIETFLDDNLYLKQEQFLQQYSSVKYSDWLRYLKRLKPVGVGARSMQERFKQQLESLGLKKSLSYIIADECWKHFIQKHNQKISDLLKVSLQDIQHAIECIQKNCKSQIFANEKCAQINATLMQSPDLLLCPDGRIILNSDCIPQIDLHNEFKKDSHNFDIAQKYIQSRLKHLHNIQTAIAKRNDTILLITKTVLDLSQKKHELKSRKRLTLKEISSNVHLSQSTVSRALNHKTILTPDGIKMVVDFLTPLTYHSA